MKNKSTKNRIVSTLGVIMSLGLLLPFSACQTLEQMAPPVGDQFRTIAARRGVAATTLELGREVYLSDCAKCHSIEPIGRYSARRWRKILPRMSRESELDEQRTAAVEAYVMLARAVLAQESDRAVLAENTKRN